MTALEISTTFDLLYNNISSNQAPGLNEYEKSVLLTKAYKELVKNYFNPKGNKYGEGFDDSAKRQMDFSYLIRTKTFEVKPELSYEGTSEYVDGPLWLHSTKVVDLQSIGNWFAVLNEECIMKYYDYYPNKNGSEGITITDTPKEDKVVVMPISNVEYDRLMSRPYKYPPKNQVWRLLNAEFEEGGPNNDPSDGGDVIEEPSRIVISAELIGKFPQKIALSTQSSYKAAEYKVKYVEVPKPIILTDLETAFGVDEHNHPITIDGETDVNIPDLPQYIWSEIIQRAVELSKITWNSNDTQLAIQAGSRSE